MRDLKPEERLIVAADFKPDPSKGRDRNWVRSQVLKLSSSLSGTRVIIKVNSSLRACGLDLINEIRGYGLKVFADLKLYDIGTTLAIDGMLLNEYRPEFVTVVCSTGIDAMQALKLQLPQTEVLGVSVLTSLEEDECQLIYSSSIEEAIELFSRRANGAGLDGLICSPKEVSRLSELFGDTMSLVTPAVRPLWSAVADDDQNLERVMTPEKAIKAGADRLVIGRPITQAANPYDAAMRTIDEIDRATQ